MISTKQFYWDKTNTIFSAEISDLHGQNLFNRVFADACDVGFSLLSAKTGNVSDWKLVDVTKNYDDEITDWVFYPTLETVRRFPTLSNAKLIVIND